MNTQFPMGTVAWVIAVAIVIWLLYVMVKVADHVQAWPF